MYLSWLLKEELYILFHVHFDNYIYNISGTHPMYERNGRVAKMDILFGANNVSL